MTGKNKYFRRSKISEAKFRRLLRLFAMDLTATDTAQLCNLSVRSVNAIYQRIRVRLAQECATQSPFSGTLEADESYFGPKRVRGKRGRGAGGKTIVFGLLKRGECVYTEIVPNAARATLQAVIRGKADLNSVIHTDGWSGYDGLVDLGWRSTFGSITATMSSPEAPGTSTALSHSGATPSIGWRSSTAYGERSLSCTSRRLSSASIIGNLTSTRLFLHCSEMSLYEAFAS